MSSVDRPGKRDHDRARTTATPTKQLQAFNPDNEVEVG